MQRILFTLGLMAILPIELYAATPRYTVVDLSTETGGYAQAAARLAELRHAELISADVSNLESLLETLKARPREYVAFVVRPEDFDENLARSILQLSTRLDADPFVDISYGFITGSTPEAAMALVEKPHGFEAKRRRPELGVVAVGTKMVTESGVNQQQFPLRTEFIPMLWGQVAGGENFPGDGRDVDFIKSLMPKLEHMPLVLVAGHGYPREVVGGPQWDDLKGLELEGSVVVNIACYTGVTGTWFEQDFASRTLKRRTVPARESFCLNVLDAGPAAYVAYACVRPAGPELFMDIPALAAEGLSVGEVRRRDYNRIVLGHLAQGHQELSIRTVAEGDPVQPPKDIVKDMLLDASTGGVLFGDPAFTPFLPQPNQSPLDVTMKKSGDEIVATVRVAGESLFYCCGEQLDTWGTSQSPAMRMACTIPLGDAHVANVKLTDLKVGGVSPAHRLIWALEEHCGERNLHVKAVFPQPTDPAGLVSGAKAVFAVEVTNDPATARRSNSESEAR